MASTVSPVSADQELSQIPSNSCPGIHDENTPELGFSIPSPAHADQGQFQGQYYSGPKSRNIIPPYHPSFARNGRSYDYEEKYDPDPLGDEIKENARVWKVYLDEAESHDFEMITGFRDTIDALLVF
ncbi:hypothetical protein F5880DRAFT_1510780, partial [Lentinula raphanica]